MSLGVSLTPARGMPHFSSLVFPKKTAVNKALTTAGGVITLTAAELLNGLLLIDTQDAQTLKVPTAALLNAAIPGVAVGSAFDVDVVNYGDSTLTLAVNTGITITTIATVAPVLTLVTLAAKRLLFVCTGVLAQGSASDAWVVYAFGSIAAAVA